MYYNATNKEVNADLHISTSESRDIIGNSENMVAGQGRTKFIICGVGVFVTYFYYGILQEDITKSERHGSTKKCIHAQRMVNISI
ncbi:hypothetical protein DPMN_075652 [Dreissena polymorpha]|uniref:Uncharacterized protein n=1 Tax=Dreissena polymorpha TaxID=45954 RepID=A0A9D3YK00_DREPO|nr:hypothetical protein DPMN_075652 [Dreissena polymorpha]